MTIDNLLALCEAIGKQGMQPNLADYGFTNTDDGWKVDTAYPDTFNETIFNTDDTVDIDFSLDGDATMIINGTVYDPSSGEVSLSGVTLEAPISVFCGGTFIGGIVLIKSFHVKNSEPWKCLKYCDSVTRDFQDAIEKNQFFVVNDPDFSGFEIVETQNEPIFQSNDKSTTFFSIEKTNIFSVVVDDDVKDVYDVVRKIDPSIKIPVKMGLKGNDHMIYQAVFKYKLGEKTDIELYTSRKLQPSDYTITYSNKDDPSTTYDSFEEMIQQTGTYRMYVECTGDYVGSAECEIIIED